MGKTSLLYAARDLFRERVWLTGYFKVRRNKEPGVAVQTTIADGAQLSTGKLRADLAAGLSAEGKPEVRGDVRVVEVRIDQARRDRDAMPQ